MWEIEYTKRLLSFLGSAWERVLEAPPLVKNGARSEWYPKDSC